MAERAVVVTGASTGIGRATAIRLDRRGWKVFAGVRRGADADALRAAASDRLVPLHLDVTDEVQIKEAGSHVDAAVGAEGLWGLVNNAGVGRGGPIEYLELADWREQFEVNVFGQIAVTRALLDPIKRAHGRIVFIGSSSARLAAPLMGPYSASKAAIESIGETLRHELRQWAIAVTVLEPGAVRTDIWDKARSESARLRDELPAEAFERYRELVELIERNIEQSDRRSVDADVAAKAVERVLTAARPPARWPVGNDAMAISILERMLPDRAKDALARRLM